MAKQNLIKIGVIGVGHLGRFHVQQLSTIEDVDLVGIFDDSMIFTFPSNLLELKKSLKI